MRKWQCAVCGFEYDEGIGMPEHGVPAGTSWEDVPDSWVCPDCGVGKADFDMLVTVLAMSKRSFSLLTLVTLAAHVMSEKVVGIPINFISRTVQL